MYIISGERILKHSRLIFLITAVVLFLGARVDAALSLEARAAIEEMRARVNNSLQTADNEPAEDKYVPGRELQTVLARYRSRVYGSPDSTDSALAHWRVSAPESRLVSADYQPGAMLEKALVNYRTQRTVFSLVKVMKAKEASAADDHAADDHPSDGVAHSADKKAQLPSTEHSAVTPVTVSSSELLTQSKTALNESVETAPQSTVDSAKSSASTTEKSLESVSENDTDDAEVQKYEFKMPRNYRILVK
jgi:hypothetical protein